MAASRNTTTLPRRAVIAGAAAALVAAPVAGARASIETGDPIFAAKKRATVAAWDNLNALYVENARRIDAMSAGPGLPARLLEPLRLPGRDGLTDAPEGGWKADSLRPIAEEGRSLAITDKGIRLGHTTRIVWLKVSAKTRKQAAELLKIREAYDAEHAAVWSEIEAIEDTAAEPLAKAIDLAFDLMAHPVFTVAEVREKMALAEEYDLFNLRDGDVVLKDLFLRDAIATAEKVVSHA